MKKYDINNFYVGDLVFPLRTSLQNREKMIEIFDVIKNGAIKYGYFYNNVYWKKRLEYKKVFTIFYKNNDKYYCLHNGKSYTLGEKDEDFCEHLTPFVNCLPKINYIMPPELSLKEELKLFNILFKKDNKRIYTKDTLNINNIYLGNLDLCWGYTHDIEEDSKFYYINSPQTFILDSQKGLFNGCLLSKIDIDSQIEYEYAKYNCLFLKLDNDKYYNLNDFCVYISNNIDKYGTSFEIKRSLPEKLDEYELNYKEMDITIPKILKLQQKINK